MDINEIAETMSREEFMNKYISNENKCICPKYYNLKDYVFGNDLCTNNTCIKCWKEAIKDIKFKGEVDNMKCMNCDREIQTEMDQLIKMAKGKVFCCGRCAVEYHNKKAEVKTEKPIKDYDREYTIQEVFEFEEGTEFASPWNGIAMICKICSEALYVENNDKEWVIAKITKNWLDAKFKLKRKEREVEFMEAMKAYMKGKTIKCKFENAIDASETEETYEPQSENGGIYLWEENYIITPLTALGKWYIVTE